MTERFKLRLSKLGNGMIIDTQKREDLYFDKEFLDATLPKANDWLNNLAKENEELKSLIKALKKSNTDYVNQIKKAYDEDLSVKELANNCGVDLE